MIERIEELSAKCQRLSLQKPERTLHAGVIEDLSGSNERIASNISKSARLDQVAEIGCRLRHTGRCFVQAVLYGAEKCSWCRRQPELCAIDSDGRERCP